jgi:hypothetical protein
MADKEFVYKITGQNDSKGTDEAKSKLDQLTGSLGESAQASGLADSKMLSLTAKLGVAAGAMYALKQAVDFASSSLSEFGNQEMLDLKQAAVIKVTGEAAGKTTSELKDMASALSEATSIDDADVQKVQTLLLTFREIKGDIYDSAVKASLDLGTIFGSAESAAMQLGKALQDPILGVSMLSRAGVTFNQSQKDQIKALVEQNDLLSAQSLILEEVQKQVAGTAEAMGSGYLGNVNRLKNAWGDFKEALGGAIASTGTLQSVMGGMTTILRQAEAGFGSTTDAVIELGKNVAAIDETSFEDAVKNAKSLKEETEKAAKETGNLETALAGLKDAQLQKALADIDLKLARGDIGQEEASFAKASIKNSFEVRKVQGEVTGLESQNAAESNAAQKAREAADKAKADADAAMAQAKAMTEQIYGVSRVPGVNNLPQRIGPFNNTQEISNELLKTTTRHAGLIQDNQITNEKEAEFRRIEKDLRNRLALTTQGASSVDQANKLKQSAAEAEATARSLEDSASAGKQVRDVQIEALNTKIEALESDFSGQTISSQKAIQERRRKEAEEREANMAPGERMGRMLGNVADTAVIGGVEYANITGQQVQEQARAAIQKAGTDLLAGGDDKEIITALIRKLQEMGAVINGGYRNLIVELDRLDGEIETLKSIQKASRQ